jgi:hypothetical protein
VPNAANGWVKVRTLQALRAAVEAERGPRVVCGDLNTPRRENPLVTFAHDRYGRMRPERGEEWDEAEAALLDGRAGVVDAYRALHRDAEEISWAASATTRGSRRSSAREPAAELREVAQTATACVRSASLSDVLRSVEALRLPMMSAAGSW